MENKLTPEEQSAMQEIAEMLLPDRKGIDDMQSARRQGFKECFNLLWPYVGEAWRAGKLYGIKEMKEYHGGPENNQPCEPDYLKKLLTALKSLPDAK